MEFKKLDSFLDTIKKALSASKKNKAGVVEIILSITGQRVPESAISFSEHSIFIRGSGALKSEIFLKKKEILAQLKEQGIIVGDIR